MPIPGYGVMKGVPRYYDDIIREDDPDLFEQVKAMRKTFIEAHGDEYKHERLIQKHQCKKARIELSERCL